MGRDQRRTEPSRPQVAYLPTDAMWVTYWIMSVWYEERSLYLWSGSAAARGIYNYIIKKKT